MHLPARDQDRADQRREKQDRGHLEGQQIVGHECGPDPLHGGIDLGLTPDHPVGIERVAVGPEAEREGLVANVDVAAHVDVRNCAKITCRIGIGRFLGMGNTAMHAGCTRS